MQTTLEAAAAHGPDRLRLDPALIDKFQRSLVVDHRRRRPLYFDGRFLAARDLVRDQNYFLTRQSDLGRAGGFGVVDGLYVDRGGTPSSLVVTAGHGVTPAGELVVVPSDLSIELTDVPEIQRLNAAFGLLNRPADPPRNRTGIFVVALRPVEFSANPIASYPTNVTGQRGVEDGEIVEGAVVTLIPYPDEGPEVSPALRRARVAHEIFVGGTAKGTAAGALPLAVVSLNRGVVEWVDVFLVRREAGATQADIVGLGFAPRALREAHLLQYEGHLREVLALRQAMEPRFAASEYFQALPPAGRMPAACINPKDFTQIFFPGTVDVDLSIVPEDEVPALVEESLALQPIDLTRTADELDSTAVLVLVPVPRKELRTISSGVASLSRSLKPAAPGMLARRHPLEQLRGLRLPGNFVPLPEPGEAEDAAWRKLLGRGGMLWYVRRRTLHHRADLAGERELLKSLQEPSGGAAELNRLQAELATKDAALTAREKAARAREEEVTKREQDVASDAGTREQALRQRAAELLAREEEMNRRNDEIRKLEGEVTRREAEIRRRESSVGSTDESIRKREAELTVREAEAQRRQAALDGRELTLKQRLAEVENREVRLGNLDATLKQRETAAAEREGGLNRRAQELDARQQVQDRRQGELDSLALRLNLDRQRNETRTNELNTLQNTLNQRQHELNVRSGQLDQTAAQIKVERDELVRLERARIPAGTATKLGRFEIP